MTIKITSGELKNRNLTFSNKFLTHNRIRPTANYTKQLIMNLIKNSPLVTDHFQLQDAIVADICCGTGAMGFEFLSNGAKKCHFIDSNELVLKGIKRIAGEIGIREKINILFSTTNLKKIEDHLDLIFIDPPYQEQERIIHNFINIAIKSDCITSKTLILVEGFKDPTSFLEDFKCKTLFTRKAVSETWIVGFNIQKIY